MNMRGVTNGPLHKAWCRAAAAGVPVDYAFLEAHQLDAGDPDDLVEGMVFARQNGLKLSAANAAARQLVAQYADCQPLRVNLADLMEAGYTNLDIAPVRPSLLTSPE